MLRTIRKGLYKSNNVRFLALLIAVAFVLLTEMACVGEHDGQSGDCRGCGCICICGYGGSGGGDAYQRGGENST